MFVCLRCGQSTGLPTCERCGYGFEMVDGVYQLTSDPSANLSGNGVRYIGYDAIGEYYHGRGWTEAPCDPVEMAGGRMIADLTARGVLLDLGSGGGTHTVPAALCGCTLVAGDISQVMLKLLLRKAAANSVHSNRLLPCRMNALSVPMTDASVDGALLNNVLHHARPHGPCRYSPPLRAGPSARDAATPAGRRGGTPTRPPTGGPRRSPRPAARRATPGRRR